MLEGLKMRLSSTIYGQPHIWKIKTQFIQRTTLKITPASKKVVICLQSAIYPYSKLKETVWLLWL